MDLLKAFDSYDHDLLLAKLEAYGLGSNAVSFMRSYLVNKRQRCKIYNSFSEWAKISSGAPQGSILGLLLSIFSSMTSSYFFKNATKQIILMTVLFIPQANAFLQL